MYGVLFLLKLKYWAYKFNENRTSLQVYSCEFSKNFQSTELLSEPCQIAFSR